MVDPVLAADGAPPTEPRTTQPRRQLYLLLRRLQLRARPHLQVAVDAPDESDDRRAPAAHVPHAQPHAEEHHCGVEGAASKAQMVYCETRATFSGSLKKHMN